MTEHFVNSCGIRVVVDNFLPIHETVSVFDIETKHRSNLLTGKMIHCIRMTDGSNMIIVSPEMFESLKNIK